MAKKREGITTEAQRLAWLIEFLGDEGLVPPGGTVKEKFSHTDIAKRLGYSQSYISKLAKPEGSRRLSIGADMIGLVLEHFGVRPDYFFIKARAGVRPNPKAFLVDERQLNGPGDPNAQVSSIAAEVAALRAKHEQLSETVDVIMSQVRLVQRAHRKLQSSLHLDDDEPDAAVLPVEVKAPVIRRKA